MDILVTGGLGYVGSLLCKKLKSNGHNVEIFDKPRDIRNEEEIREAIKGKDIVYHLAALAELKYTDAHPQETYSVNILGTNIIAKMCAEEKVLLNFISTCCIYGEPLEYPSIEDSLINPTDTYAMTKAAGEYIVKMWGLSKGLRYNILRLGTVYGPSIDREMRNDMCIQKFLDAAIKGENISITGDGTQSRNFIYIKDLVDALALVTEREIEGEMINLAGDESVSVNDIARYAKLFGAKKTKRIESRKDDFHDQDVSIEKAKRLLNWKPKRTFDKGIQDFFKWLV
jgi:UDP-glucose 4-epimerase